MGKGGGGGPDYTAMIQQMNDANAKAMAAQKNFYDKQHQDFLASEQKKLEDAKAADLAATIASEQDQLGQLYNTRVTQVNNASSTVDKIIQQEQAAARLNGSVYNITDEQRISRISDELAKLRTAADDQKIIDLATKYSDYAKKQGFDTNWLIKLGTVPVTSTTKSTSSTLTAPVSTVLTDDEENDKVKNTILG